MTAFVRRDHGSGAGVGGRGGGPGGGSGGGPGGGRGGRGARPEEAQAARRPDSPRGPPVAALIDAPVLF